jgi:transcriptional regulator with XRE-family HTH domain
MRKNPVFPITKVSKVIDSPATGREARRLRKLLKRNQNDVARRMKISTGMLSMLEAGKRTWTTELAQLFYLAL